MEDISKLKAWQKGPGISPGEDFEVGLLGAAVLTKGDYDMPYMSFAESVEFAKPRQPNALQRPPFVVGLRKAIAEKCSNTSTPVKFFTAVGTPLDVYHGVDAFFEQDGAVVTIDVSLRDKEGVQKADVAIFGSLDKDGRPIVTEADIADASQKIADTLDQRRLRKAA